MHSLTVILLALISSTVAFQRVGQARTLLKSPISRYEPLCMSSLAVREKSVVLKDFDYRKEKKLPWLPSGYKKWVWRGHNINYVDLGGSEDEKKPPLLLIHGFGASVYHWRYNIPELARKYHVYAVDLLGFGLSDKPIIEYDAKVWRDQVLSFIEEVIHEDQGRKAPCVVAGNSLGGFTALYAAAANEANEKRLINGCILLNAAGRFRANAKPETEDTRPEWLKGIQAAFQRFVISLSFYYTKQPLRIEQILRQVYPVDASNVDAELVDSIQYPAQNPNAPEVFFRVISRNGNGPPVFIDDLLMTLRVPLLLLWGDKDPWIRPQVQYYAI
jgi:pimeloyl-ACP methyl ester carboxylesterase